MVTLLWTDMTENITFPRYVAPLLPSAPHKSLVIRRDILVNTVCKYEDWPRWCICCLERLLKELSSCCSCNASDKNFLKLYEVWILLLTSDRDFSWIRSIFPLCRHLFHDRRKYEKWRCERSPRAVSWRCKMMSLINKSANWPPLNYHKTARTFPQISFTPSLAPLQLNRLTLNEPAKSHSEPVKQSCLKYLCGAQHKA